jgi:hypothetical protein
MQSTPKAGAADKKLSEKEVDEWLQVFRENKR